jgi:hypothetical protein
MLREGGRAGNMKYLVREEVHMGFWWDMSKRLLGRPKRKRER